MSHKPPQKIEKKIILQLILFWLNAISSILIVQNMYVFFNLKEIYKEIK